MRAVFLVAPKDLHEGPDYEASLEVLAALHPKAEIVPDRGLFADTTDWRRRWKGIFDLADALYVLPRADLTVGLGVFKEWRRLSLNGTPCFRLDPVDPRGPSPTDRFGLQKTGNRLPVPRATGEPEEGPASRPLDFRRFAKVVPLSGDAGGSRRPEETALTASVTLRESEGPREVVRVIEGPADARDVDDGAAFLEGMHMALFGKRAPEGLYGAGSPEATPPASPGAPRDPTQSATRGRNR